MKLSALLAAVRHRTAALARARTLDREGRSEEREADADEVVDLGPEGPLGPTGGQVGNPQRF